MIVLQSETPMRYQALKRAAAKMYGECLLLIESRKLTCCQDYEEIRQEFEFFDPQASWDFEGFKRLLRQLFDADAASFHLGAIADLILAQPLLGSTIKTEGNESDPHAFLTILNLEEHKVRLSPRELSRS